MQTSNSSTKKFEDFLNSNERTQSSQFRRGKDQQTDEHGKSRFTNEVASSNDKIISSGAHQSPKSLIKSFSQLVQENGPSDSSKKRHMLDAENTKDQYFQGHSNQIFSNETQEDPTGLLKESDLLKASDLFSKDTYVQDRMSKNIYQQNEIQKYREF